ncbi:MAG TPA: glutamate formimidoyltransferase [Acidobacteria bacterium]|nr:glutamate formimidoyltransferase [Acidobacteriota bacterium]
MACHSEDLPPGDCGIRPGVTLIEAVPNVSEGRRAPVIQALAAAVRGQPGVTLLDVSSDAAHNRTVFTLVGLPNALHSALLSLYAVAIEAIDLRSHTGEHPRIGAVDVVPLVPLAVADMGVCVSTATALAEAVAARFDIPVYLYGRAARGPERERLELVRRGEFEGLASKMSGHSWDPDFGPARPHPSAGASAIGARKILIAFNVNLRTADLDIARQIARRIRASSGGLPAVKAIGVRTEDPEIVQVSINLVDHETTALHTVFAAVENEAQRRGVVVEASEIVGLAPAGALLSTAAHCLGLRDVTMDQVLDCRLPR